METYIKGPLHLHNEKGVIYFKNLVEDVLYKHMQEEQKPGRKCSRLEGMKLQPV